MSPILEAIQTERQACRKLSDTPKNDTQKQRNHGSTCFEVHLC